jgi:iron complex outermembrane recepter protein
MMRKNKSGGRRQLGLATGCGLAVALGHISVSLAAQPANKGGDDPKDDLQEVVVTGTIIRGIDPPGAQTVTLDRVAIEATGLTTIADVARTLPQVQNLGFSESVSFGQGAAANQQRGTSINLRGLGPNATLLLLDGNRITPSGTVGTFTEANIVPVAALQRIEVVADGASALYGSDAIAGVVNYVLRRDFVGVEGNVRYTSGKYWDQYGGNVLAGTKWELGGRPGNVLFTYDFDHQDPMLSSSSRFIRQDMRPFGGNDNRIVGNGVTSGSLTNIVVPTTTPNTVYPTAGNNLFYTVAPGNTGVPTAASLALNQLSLATNGTSPADYIQKNKRQQFVFVANQQLTDRLDFGVTGIYNRRDSDSRAATLGSYTVPATSPFYITGIPGQAAGAPLAVRYNYEKDFGLSSTNNLNKAYAVIGRLGVELGGGWRGTASLNRGLDVVDRTNPNSINNTAAQAAINNGLFNPFDTRPLSSSVLSGFRGNFLMYGETRLFDYVVKADGPLMDTRAGTIRVAAGGEYTRTDTLYRQGSPAGLTNVFTLARNTRMDRDVKAAFAEVFIPLVGKDMGIRGVHSLTLDVAARTEKYSDFGRTTNPRVGVEWATTESLSLRGSWSTSFRAPGIASKNPGTFQAVANGFVVNNAGNPLIPVDVPSTRQTRVITRGGSNSELLPEESDNYSLGFEYTPEAVEGLKLSASYYNYKYKQQIAQLFINGRDFLASPGNAEVFAPFIIPTPAPAGCVEGNPSTYNPLVAALATGSIPVTGPFCSVRAILDARDQNASSTKQDGLDVSVAYEFERWGGQLNVGASGSYLFNVKTAFTEGSPLVERVDTINYPVALRARFNAGWSRGPYNVGLIANVVGSYKNNLPITVLGVTQPVKSVPSWTTLDLNLGYRSSSEEGLLSGVRANLTIQNLTDRDPPVVLSSNGGTQGYAFDNQNHNPFGRIFRFQLTKSL